MCMHKITHIRHMHAFIHAHACACAHTLTHTHTHIHKHTHTHIHTHTLTHTHTHLSYSFPPSPYPAPSPFTHIYTFIHIHNTHTCTHILALKHTARFRILSKLDLGFVCVFLCRVRTKGSLCVMLIILCLACANCWKISHHRALTVWGDFLSLAVWSLLAG